MLSTQVLKIARWLFAAALLTALLSVWGAVWGMPDCHDTDDRRARDTVSQLPFWSAKVFYARCPS
jgi:hypothetical protein